jgi:hypothetical protein
MRSLLWVTGLLLLSAGTMAAAADNGQPPEDKIICKRVYDADTGSHFTSSVRVCHKASEWKELDDETQRTMRTIHDSHGVNPNDLAPTMGGPG